MNDTDIAIRVHSMLLTAESALRAGDDNGFEIYNLAADLCNSVENPLAYLAVTTHCERVLRETVLPACDFLPIQDD